MAEVHLLTDKGESPLHLAVNVVVNKHAEAAGPGEAGMEVVKHLLQAGCDVNQATKTGLTALHQASRHNCPNLVRQLLDWEAEY